MRLLRKHRLIISLALVLVLMAPVSIQSVDGIFHHHDDFVCHAKKTPHFHKQHKVCPIPGFTLSVYDFEVTSFIAEIPFYFLPDIPFLNRDYYKTTRFYFSLRAPPLRFYV